MNEYIVVAVIEDRLFTRIEQFPLDDVRDQ